MARPTDTPTDATDASPADYFTTVVAELTNGLLDAWYDAHPSSSAFGCDYDGIGTDPDGTYFIGREHGADGSDDDAGFDYFYRRFPDPENPRQEETAYVYGNYGWMDENDLVDERPRLRQVIAEAVARDLLDEPALDRFDEAADALEDGLQRERDQYDLQDVAQLFQGHEIDTLRTLLGHGDEEGRVIWQLCFSKDEDGNHVENPIGVPVISERDQFMLVRTERYYYDDQAGEGKHYAYGAVIGYDDTPQRFFVHRLESDSDLTDPETDWTPALVKEKMGFDANLHEVDAGDLPYGDVVRIQGDLAMVRHDYERALHDERDRHRTLSRNRVLREHGADYPEFTDVDGVSLNSVTGQPRVYPDDTDALTALQDAVGLPEETVRREQDERGWSRLTAGRRQELVAELLTERVYEWACEQSDRSRRSRRSQAAVDAQEAFLDTDEQNNAVIGNHTVIMGPATEHPDRTFGDDGTRQAYVVPEEATAFVIHDEHADKQLTLGPGVYEFRFLQGYEDEWWM